MPVGNELQSHAATLQRAALLETPASRGVRAFAARPTFSAFRHEDLLGALQMFARLRRQAHSSPDVAEGLRLTLQSASDELSAGQPGRMVAHAFGLLGTHDPVGRELRLARPIESVPELLLPKPKPTVAAFGAAGPEAALDYWREDLLANEHHWHWHIVYPGVGLVRDDAPPELLERFERREPLNEDELRQLLRYQDRHGELFVYMHQQMLARYDAERLSVGMQPVSSFVAEVNGAPIPEAFDPGAVLTGFGFASRAPDRQLDAADRAALLTAYTALQEAIEGGAFVGRDGALMPIDIDNLGANLEPTLSIFRFDADPQIYGDLHNAGHGAIAALAPPDSSGVMVSTLTAIRDPVFYRWHRTIDDLAFDWQERQAPLAFEDAPKVSLARGASAWTSPALILLNASDIPDSLDEAGRRQLARELFGGEQWSQDFTAAAARTPSGSLQLQTLDTLATKFQQASVRIGVGADPDQRVDVSHLTHEPFAIVIRVENVSDQPIAATLRVFLVPATQAENRRAWIELDKFTARLAARAKEVLLRLDRESEVVKKPVDLGPDRFIPARDQDDGRCSCGWPYPLLLPRGTNAGMEFRLAVIATDATIDGFVTTHRCGSVSFCGARDSDYPDKRSMGYPFSRRWSTPIEQAFRSQVHMAARTVRIVHRQ